MRGSSSSWSPNSGERYSYSRDYGRSGGGLDLGSLLLGGLLLGGGHNYGGWSSHHHDSDWGGGGGFFSGGGDFSPRDQERVARGQRPEDLARADYEHDALSGPAEGLDAPAPGGAGSNDARLRRDVPPHWG